MPNVPFTLTSDIHRDAIFHPLRSPQTDRKVPTRASTETRRLSGVQLEVLRLYRHFMKAAQQKQDESTRTGLKKYIKEQFRLNQRIPRYDVQRVEWHLHFGKRKLEELLAAKPTMRFTNVS